MTKFEKNDYDLAFAALTYANITTEQEDHLREVLSTFVCDSDAGSGSFSKEDLFATLKIIKDNIDLPASVIRGVKDSATLTNEYFTFIIKRNEKGVSWKLEPRS